ncbi:unnamed protein product [Dovyalis caffra]|uniref:Uncharacterized protein n=1 Tax=Dovyalis caffra TaxID=77055 RepID=A0AAV1SFT4_9ROSI|nr:unnamed protein product [Dovyalis caffra]
MAASISIKRLLLESSEPASTSMNLHPKQTQDAHTSSSSSPSSKSTRTKFGAEAHEVPSGPNPISNSAPLILLVLSERFVSLLLCHHP